MKQQFFSKYIHFIVSVERGVGTPIHFRFHWLQEWGQLRRRIHVRSMKILCCFCDCPKKSVFLGKF